MKNPNDENDDKKLILSNNKNIRPERVSDIENSIFLDLKLKNLLLDFASDSIWVIDFKGNFRYVNEAAYKTRGFTKKELMNLNIHDLDAPEDSELIDQHLKELMETGEAKYETVHYHKDGSQISVEIHAQKIDLNGQKLVLSVIKDLTILKNYQKNLKKEIKNQTEEFRKLNRKQTRNDSYANP